MGKGEENLWGIFMKYENCVSKNKDYNTFRDKEIIL
jgi:hypothetical protein